jgi:16S rRNA (cytidine1402-2'-O)-methyltransferase
LPTHTFTFLGFLPRTSTARRKLLSQHAESEVTLLVFESPHRVIGALKDVVASLGEDRPIAIGRELTKHFEEIFRGTASAALAHFEHHPPRGEFTFVIGGRSAPVPGSAA